MAKASYRRKEVEFWKDGVQNRKLVTGKVIARRIARGKIVEGYEAVGTAPMVEGKEIRGAQMSRC